jgi:outer membrane protein assembly factor BamB
MTVIDLQGGFALTQRFRVLAAALGLLLVVVLSACGAAPVAENWPGLTVAEDTVYLISGVPQEVYLLDAETGDMKATYVPQGEHKGVLYWSPVTVGADDSGSSLAFAGFADPASQVHGLYAFEPETAQERWRVAAESLILPAPVYADGAVYFGSSDGRVYAVDVETRSVKPGWPFQAEEAIWASPLVVEERVYVPSMDHHLYCLDAESGQPVWVFEAGGALAAGPILDPQRGILYVGGFDGKLYAIDADSGQAVEGFDFQAQNWIWSEVLLVNDELYVTSLDGKLYTLDPVTGMEISPAFDSGTVSGQDESDTIRAAPVQAGEFILVATESGRVIAVKDGVSQWSWPSGAPEVAVLTTPIVRDGRVYVALANGQLQTLQADSGVQGWSFSPPEGQ